MTFYVLVILLEVLRQDVGVVKTFLWEYIASVNFSFIPRMLCHKEAFLSLNFIYHYFSFQRLKVFKAWNSCMESFYEIVPKHFLLQVDLISVLQR